MEKNVERQVKNIGCIFMEKNRRVNAEEERMKMRKKVEMNERNKKNF